MHTYHFHACPNMAIKMVKNYMQLYIWYGYYEGVIMVSILQQHNHKENPFVLTHNFLI